MGCLQFDGHLILDALPMPKLCCVQVLCRTSGSSLGYGYTSTIDDDDDP